jgi:hypothetical protein
MWKIFECHLLGIDNCDPSVRYKSNGVRYKSNGVRYKSNGVRYKSNGVRIDVIFVSIDFHTRLSNTYAYPDPPNMNDLFLL